MALCVLKRVRPDPFPTFDFASASVYFLILCREECSSEESEGEDSAQEDDRVQDEVVHEDDGCCEEGTCALSEEASV